MQAETASSSRTEARACGLYSPSRRHGRSTCETSEGTTNEFAVTGSSKERTAARYRAVPAVVLPLSEPKHHLAIQTLVYSRIRHPRQRQALAQARAVLFLCLQLRFLLHGLLKHATQHRHGLLPHLQFRQFLVLRKFGDSACELECRRKHIRLHRPKDTCDLCLALSFSTFFLSD